MGLEPQLTVGSTTAWYNDEKRELSASPVIVDSTIFASSPKHWARK